MGPKGDGKGAQSAGWVLFAAYLSSKLGLAEQIEPLCRPPLGTPGREPRKVGFAFGVFGDLCVVRSKPCLRPAHVD